MKKHERWSSFERILTFKKLSIISELLSLHYEYCAFNEFGVINTKCLTEKIRLLTCEKYFSTSRKLILKPVQWLFKKIYFNAHVIHLLKV